MVTTNVKTDVIDADAHVVENERVWDYLDTGEKNIALRYWPNQAIPSGSIGFSTARISAPSFLRPTRSNLKSISNGSAGKSKLRWKPGSLVM